MPPELPEDHLFAICQVLVDHGVDFVIIGGVAARLHDTGYATVDIDICPSRTEDNLTRLADALVALDARLRVADDPGGVAFTAHGDLLRQMTTMTLLTNCGPLDLCFTPAGFPGGYDELVADAVVVSVAGTNVRVASLNDVIASKRAAGRPKDVVALPALEEHRRRLET